MRIISAFLQCQGLPCSCFGFAGSESSEYQKEFKLPDDITIEILSRLPVKSLLRCKCVCRSWHAIIQDKVFVEKHMYQHDKIHQYEYENTEIETLVSSDDALVLEISHLTNRYRMRNPSTRQILDLPHLEVNENCLVLDFVYLPMINNCKLIHIFRKEGTRNAGCEVLIPGVDLTWRTVDIPGFYNLVNNDGFNVKSFDVKDVYFVASFFLAAASGICHKLVYLELGSESSGNLEIPQDFFPDWGNVELFSWKHCMLSVSSLLDEELHVWILEDYKKEKWADQKIVISLTFINKYPIQPHMLYPVSVTNDHWLWFNLNPKFDLGYNIQSKEVYFKTPRSGKRFSCRYLPSLLSLPGFRPDHYQNRSIKCRLSCPNCEYLCHLLGNCLV